MSIKRVSEEPYAVTQLLGIEDCPDRGLVVIQLGTPDGAMVEVACAYRAAHLIAAALGRWQTYRTALQAGRKTAKKASVPGRLTCCP